MKDSGEAPDASPTVEVADLAMTSLLGRLAALEISVNQLTEQVESLRAESALKASELREMQQALRERVERLHLLHFLRGPFRRATALVTPRLYGLRHYPPRALSPLNSAPAPDPAPSISIVTPSYQQGQFIEATINSVLTQDYPNLEYVIQDGASDDGTIDVLKRYASELHAWDTGRDQGQADAINKAFGKTNGELMAWLNSDDLLLPGALSTVAHFFQKHPDVDVVYGDRVIIDEGGLQVGRWILPKHDDEVLSWADYVPQETLFWRRRIWDKIGAALDTSFKFAMDWDLLVRFREAGAKMVHIPRQLGAFRVHDEQKTSVAIATIGAIEMRRIRQRVLGYSPTDRQIHKAISPLMRRHLAAHFQLAVAERSRTLFTTSKRWIQSLGSLRD